MYRLSSCGQPAVAPSFHTANYPIVVFSLGLSLPRLPYKAIVQWVAIFVYLVVTMDRPYDANIRVIPDGTLVFGVNSTQAQLDLDVDTRAKNSKHK